MIRREYLREIAAEKEIALSDEILELLDRYAELLVEWNGKINLTAIVEPDEIAVKHFLDSLLLISRVEVPSGASVIDVGTGAGFPSIPCALVRPDLKLTLLDSLNKRIVFLKELTGQLGVKSACVHARAEEAGQQAAFREKFDLATARAVAHLRDLSEYCLPFVKVGGVFVALKGLEIEEELGEAQAAIRILGGKVERVLQEHLPDESGRSLVVVRKISQTSTKYPRMSAKIKKQPLS